MRNIRHYYDLVDRYIYHNDPGEQSGQPQESKSGMNAAHCVFPTPDIIKTAEYYHDKLGFIRVLNMDAREKYIALKRDGIELMLTESNGQKVVPNHELYGYGGDAYVTVTDLQALQDEFEAKGVRIVQPLHESDFRKKEFVIEDIDGRWIYFGSNE